MNRFRAALVAVCFLLPAMLVSMTPATYAATTAVTAVPAAAPAALAPQADTVVVTDDTSVVLPYGSWLSSVGDLVSNYALPALMLVVTGFVATLPGYARVLAGTFLTEANMRRAIQFAINQVAGAAAGKTLTVDVGNRVIAVAVQRFIDTVPSWLLGWSGGAEDVRSKVIARLDLDGAASQATVPAKVLKSVGRQN